MRIVGSLHHRFQNRMQAAHDLQLPCVVTLVWPPTRSSHHCHPLHPRRHCHGRHEPAPKPLPHLPNNLRHPLPRPIRCQHSLFHLLLHQFRARRSLRLRPQTGPLHENPSQTPLQSPNHRHTSVILHPNWRPQLDVRQYPRPLQRRRCQWFQLPHCSRTLQRQYPLGRRRPSAFLRPRHALPASYLGVPHRRHRAHPSLASQPPQPLDSL